MVEVGTDTIGFELDVTRGILVTKPLIDTLLLDATLFANVSLSMNSYV